MIHHLTKASIVTASLLLIDSCSSPQQRHVESNISRAPKDPTAYQIISKKSPRLLTFDELSTLLLQPGEHTEAAKKATTLFNSPFIDNTHFKKNGFPKPQSYQNLGPCLRVSTWNIEKSIQIANVAKALSSEDAFKDHLKPQFLTNNSNFKDAIRQRATLAASDILLCQEMDIGHCRSDYLFAARHLAKALDMNFVYAPQQLEIDPIHLGLPEVKLKNQSLSTHPCNITHSKHQDYKGVFGVAVLSRYPIKRVQVFPLKNQPYDWYAGEIQKPDSLENLRRYSSRKIFKFQPSREIKKGGRGFTRVDLHVPGIPHETLTVINIHLEIKTPPKQRLLQLNEILSYMSEIKNPVVMAGDLNNSSRDISATSIARATTRSVSNPGHILSTGLHLADAAIVGRMRSLINTAKNFKNPLAWHIPVILPNRKKSLFKLVKNYHFDDGGVFDFRGDKNRSVRGHTGDLSNSNQRSYLKRFTFTFSAPRPIGPIGKDRLDWIFVKSLLSDQKDKNGPYQLAPHFGETLKLMNLAVKKPYSDHHPITVLLPINEPKL